MKKSILILVFGLVSILSSLSFAQAQNMDKEVTVIELTQTPNQFTTQSLSLKPGKYQFKVTNQNVDKELGFVIQKESEKSMDVMKTAIPNSFTTKPIKKGETQLTGIVELKAGTYVYSCPLNPTPHYTISVK